MRIFLSTLSLRRATHLLFQKESVTHISIHALLAESDGCLCLAALALVGFLSTLSLRRATCSASRYLSIPSYFYPRSPCGERLYCHCFGTSYSRFLSTLSLRRATNGYGQYYIRARISIHALLAESDFTSVVSSTGTIDFYPRSPCGERRWLRCWQSAARDISIHALLAESDYLVNTYHRIFGISIHALLAESDHYDNYNLHCVEISIHALLAESDVLWVLRKVPLLDFYPRSPCGERLACGPKGHAQHNFYPRSPCGERL